MSAVRHELVNGQIFAMAGETPEHAALSAAVLVLLGSKMLGGRGRPYSADLRIRVLATGLATHRVHESGDTVELPSLGVAFTTDQLYDAAGIIKV